MLFPHLHHLPFAHRFYILSYIFPLKRHFIEWNTLRAQMETSDYTRMSIYVNICSDMIDFLGNSLLLVFPLWFGETQWKHLRLWNGCESMRVFSRKISLSTCLYLMNTLAQCKNGRRAKTLSVHCSIWSVHLYLQFIFFSLNIIDYFETYFVFSLSLSFVFLSFCSYFIKALIELGWIDG